MSSFTVPESGWYVLDPDALGGASKVEPGEPGAVLLTDAEAQAITFDSVPLTVRWRHP